MQQRAVQLLQFVKMGFQFVANDPLFRHERSKWRLPFFRRREPPDRSVMMYASKKGMSLRHQANKSPAQPYQNRFLLGLQNEIFEDDVERSSSIVRGSPWPPLN